MSLTNPNTPISQQDLQDFYHKILPYIGGSGGTNYSTDEKIIGTWINNEPLYQKTVVTGGSIPSGATLIERIAQTGYDTLRYIKS